MTKSKQFQSFDDELPHAERADYRRALLIVLELGAIEGDARAIAYLNRARKAYETVKREREMYLAKVKE